MFKRLIERVKYWVNHKHPCEHCCLFCKFYEKCKDDTEGNANRCVCCGDVIPEGRQVCPKCERQ
jgi:hypothetical protein